MSSIKNFKPSKKSAFKQGYYYLNNPTKYKGDCNKIIFRSGWERKFCIYCDTNPSILEWSSEPFKITYLSQVDNKQHRYFPDFYIKTKKNDTIKEYVVEIKPNKYSTRPKPPQKKTKKKLKDYHNTLKRFLINESKWKAAQRASIGNGYEFIVITENFLNKI